MRVEQEQDAAAAAMAMAAVADWSEDDLPSADELMPLSRSLITPELALAFDIPTAAMSHHPNHPYPPQSFSVPGGAGSDFDSSDLNSASAAASGGGGVAGSDEPARTLKRPRLVWTPQLHKRFVDAVAHLGIKNAVPKTIMQLMSVDGLTRENVASHLQKYRLYLKRMQGLSAGGPISAADAATDQLFASAPVPHHFLNRGPVGGPGGPGEPFLPFVPVPALQHHQITSTMQQQQQQQQYYQQRHIGHFGSPTSGNGGFDHGFLSRTVSQPGMHRMVAPTPGMGLVGTPPSSAGPYGDDAESGERGRSGGRKVLTLFPNGED